MAPPGIEQLLLLLKDLPLQEALTLLTTQGIAHYSAKGYGKVKELIRNKYLERAYAFVPDKEEAQLLKQLHANPAYREVRDLVPGYRHLDLIRTGLLIRHYHERPTRTRAERTSQIKAEITNRPNGHHLLRIVNLPTTPFFSTIIGFIRHLKYDENYTAEQLAEKFEEIVDHWEHVALFVKATTGITAITKFCEERMRQQHPFLFLLGMKSAAATILHALDQLEETNTFSENGYSPSLKKSQTGLTPRVEVAIIKKVYVQAQ